MTKCKKAEQMVSVRLDNELESALEHFSKKNNISKSKVIKNSLLYYFDMIQKKSKAKTPYELGNDLFGKYSSGRDDLSTTYKQKVKDIINAKNNHR